jgi:tRNA A37 threonylcarbamoyladenosine modification protein TsaB
MFLFLDVASPISEFHLINDKKIIDSIKITNNTDQKLSDLLIPTYIKIDNDYKLSKKLKKLIITIGPGSYTALRVGASFIAGLSQSMDLPVAVISTTTIYKHLSDTNKQIGIYFESSNNQKFFLYKKNLEYINIKIENQNFIIPELISYIFYNIGLPKFIDTKIKSEIFSIKMHVLENLHKMEFNKNLIIKPIYISNNSILN